MATLLPDTTLHAEAAAKHACAPEWRLARRTRPHYQLWIVTGGRGQLMVADHDQRGEERAHELDAGTVVVIPPNVPQWGTHDPRQPLRCYVLHVSARVLGAAVPEALAGLPGRLRPRPPAWRRVVADAETACRELADPTSAGVLAANAAVTDLLAQLWREAETQRLLRPSRPDPAAGGGAGDDARRVAAVLEYVAWNHGRRLTLGDLAAVANLSRAHLCTMFRRATGVAPFEYLHRYRMQRARELLERTTLSVAEIAATVGVPDPYYFSRAFKRSEGVSPRAYREARRKLNEP